MLLVCNLFLFQILACIIEIFAFSYQLPLICGFGVTEYYKSTLHASIRRSSKGNFVFKNITI